MRSKTTWTSLLLLTSLGALGLAQPPRPIRIAKEKPEPATQTLDLPQDPPAAVAVETGKLVFHISPLSGKGLLSQQVRDALKALDKANGKAALVKIRAFVAGTGDLRRVQGILSEDFSGGKTPLPVVTTVRVGGLPMTGAQVLIEAVSEDTKTVNPNGLAFFSGMMEPGPAEAVRRLEESARAAGVAGDAMLRVTCFLGSISDADATRAAVSAAFPKAAAGFVQRTRLGADHNTACEGVARLAAGAGQSSRTAALVRTPRLVLTGAQMAFSGDEAAVRLAVDRAKKSAESMGAGEVVFASVYPVRGDASQWMSKILAEMFRPDLAGTSLEFEALPAVDATVAIDLAATAR